jgi:hypothetical protein
VLAQDGEVGAERGLAGETGPAAPARDRRVDDDGIAGHEAVDPVADGIDHARPVRAGHVGDMGLGAAAGHPQIHVVETTRHQPHPHLARPDLRVRNIAVAVVARGLVEHPRLHQTTARNRSGSIPIRN